MPSIKRAAHRRPHHVRTSTWSYPYNTSVQEPCQRAGPCDTARWSSLLLRCAEPAAVCAISYPGTRRRRQWPSPGAPAYAPLSIEPRPRPGGVGMADVTPPNTRSASRASGSHRSGRDETTTRAELKRVTHALETFGPMRRDSLVQACGTRHWHTGEFNGALRTGIREGTLRELSLGFIATVREERLPFCPQQRVLGEVFLLLGLVHASPLPHACCKGASRPCARQLDTSPLKTGPHRTFSPTGRDSDLDPHPARPAGRSTHVVPLMSALPCLASAF